MKTRQPVFGERPSKIHHGHHVAKALLKEALTGHTRNSEPPGTNLSDLTNHQNLDYSLIHTSNNLPNSPFNTLEDPGETNRSRKVG